MAWNVVQRSEGSPTGFAVTRVGQILVRSVLELSEPFSTLLDHRNESMDFVSGGSTPKFERRVRKAQIIATTQRNDLLLHGAAERSMPSSFSAQSLSPSL